MSMQFDRGGWVIVRLVTCESWQLNDPSHVSIASPVTKDLSRARMGRLGTSCFGGAKTCAAWRIAVNEILRVALIEAWQYEA
jgi:hypothetical protein